MAGSSSHSPAPSPPAPAVPAGPGAARPQPAAAPNRAWSRLATPYGPLQTQLTVNAPGDAHEQEADRVADQVMRMPEPSLTAAEAPAIQRMCADCEEEQQVQRALPEEDEIQAKEDAGTPAGAPATVAPQTVAPQTAARIGSLRGGGQPLSAELRGYFEPRFGQDLSAVRLHTGSQAEQAAAEVRARAFTVGSDIAFAPGELQPESPRGRRLLAHELVHTVQQGAGGGPVDD